MIASRAFAIVACAFLVASFALATLLPPDLPLGQALLSIDPHVLEAARDAVRRDLSPALWADILVPVLMRPAWVVPAMLGTVLGGVSLTLRPQKPAPTRRRS